MLDHVGLNVSNFDVSKAFYLRALEPLGIRTVMEFPEWKSLGLGDGHKPYLWIHERDALDLDPRRARRAGRRDGGRVPRRGDRGGRHRQRRARPSPALPPELHGAFVLDPDGNNIEAVCHRAPVPAA